MPQTNKNDFSFKSNLVDLIKSEIYPALIEIENKKIKKVTRIAETLDTYTLPGFVDSHIHIESSMVTPSEFARIAVRHGTVGVVADPHEIANVLGLDGINFMINNGKDINFNFFFAAPSCVPATDFETSGATINSIDIENILKKDEITHLGEVMNVPGVINEESEVIKKIKAAIQNNKPIDGHAPQVFGDALKKYINSGISTDHECATIEEAIEKINLGMKIQIREGSAAKDFDALCSLIDEHNDFCMFSSDDKHPNELIKGHINLLVKKAIKMGFDKMNVLKCASLNPIKHYNLDVGLLQEGDNADFIQINNLDEFKILKTVIKGSTVFKDGISLICESKTELINNFNTEKLDEKDIEIESQSSKEINVIKVTDGSLITKRIKAMPKIQDKLIISDIENDILKIVVLNRYEKAKPAIGFIKGFGLKEGAIASSVAHDSHNIIAVGTNDKDLIDAINIIIENKGGLCATKNETSQVLQLPVAGLMSDKNIFDVAKDYESLLEKIENFGSELNDAFMTLSFISLLAIPEIKLSDKGLFDASNFNFIDLFD